MKLLLGVLLMIGGICGTVMSFTSDIVVNSSVSAIDGLDLSTALALFSIVVFLNGVYDMFLTN